MTARQDIEAAQYQVKGLREGQRHDFTTGDCLDMSFSMDDAADSIEKLIAHIKEQDAEIARLTKCLTATNSNAESFERKWYLQGDEIERLRELLTGSNGALTRMERARGWLTDDNPRSFCNWGVLDTEDLRAAITQTGD